MLFSKKVTLELTLLANPLTSGLSLNPGSPNSQHACNQGNGVKYPGLRYVCYGCSTTSGELYKLLTLISSWVLTTCTGWRLHCCLSCAAAEHWPFHQLQYSMERTFISHSQRTITSMVHFICKNSTKKYWKLLLPTQHISELVAFFSNQHCFFL